jgi:hypothetical protein
LERRGEGRNAAAAGGSSRLDIDDLIDHFIGGHRIHQGRQAGSKLIERASHRDDDPGVWPALEKEVVRERLKIVAIMGQMAIPWPAA